MRMNAKEYSAKYNVSVHMVSYPNGKDKLETGFIKSNGYMCLYPGGYLHYSLQDIRKFKSKFLLESWADYKETPFRIYISDYDDWNAEQMFSSKEEAEKVLDQMKASPITIIKIKQLGFIRG